MSICVFIVPVFTVVGIAIVAMLADMKRHYLAAVRRIPRELTREEIDDRIAELERQFVL